MKVGMNIKTQKKNGEITGRSSICFRTYKIQLQRWRNGEADPGIETLVHASDYFSIPLDVIFRKDFSEYTEEMFEMLRKDRLADVEGKKLAFLGHSW